MSNWFLKEVVNKERGPPLFLNQNDNVIGRKVGAFIRLSSTFASRHHCTIRVADDKATLIDHKTLNGTYIGVDKIPTNREIPLINGDCIGIGLAANEFSTEPYFILYKTDVDPDVQDVGDECDATQVYPKAEVQPDSTTTLYPGPVIVNSALDYDDATFKKPQIPRSVSVSNLKVDSTDSMTFPNCTVALTKLNAPPLSGLNLVSHGVEEWRSGSDAVQRDPTVSSAITSKQEANTSESHEYSMCDDIILIESDEDENDLPCSQLFNISRRNDRVEDRPNRVEDGLWKESDVIQIDDDEELVAEENFGSYELEADLISDMLIREFKVGSLNSVDEMLVHSQMSPETYMLRVNNENCVGDIIPSNLLEGDDDLLAALMTQKDLGLCGSFSKQAQAMVEVLEANPCPSEKYPEKSDQMQAEAHSFKKVVNPSGDTSPSETSISSKHSERKRKKTSCGYKSRVKSGSRKSLSLCDSEEKSRGTSSEIEDIPLGKSPRFSSPSVQTSEPSTSLTEKLDKVKHRRTSTSKVSPMKSLKDASKKLKATLSTCKATESSKNPYNLRASEKRIIRESRKRKLRQMALKEKEEKLGEWSESRSSSNHTIHSHESSESKSTSDHTIHSHECSNISKTCFVKNTETNRGAILIDSIPKVSRKRNTSCRLVNGSVSERRCTSKGTETNVCKDNTKESGDRDASCLQKTGDFGKIFRRSSSRNKAKYIPLTDSPAGESRSILKKRLSNSTGKSVQFARPDDLTSVKYYDKEDTFQQHGASTDMGQVATHRQVFIKGKPLTRDNLLFIFLKWNPRWIEESVVAKTPPPLLNTEFPCPSPVSLLYTSYTHYQNTLLPLQVSELWQSIVKDVNSQTEPCQYVGLVRDVEERTDGIHVISVSSFVQDAKETPKRGDLVIVRNVERTSKSMMWLSFGFIENPPIRKPLQHSDSFSLSAYRTLSGGNCGRQTFTLNLQVTIRPKRTKFWSHGLKISILPVYNLNVELKLFQTLEKLVFSPLGPLVLDPISYLSGLSSLNSADLPFKQQQRLNKEQMSVVNYCAQMVLDSKPSLALVHGPPGTGKSVTITHLVMTMLEQVKKDKVKMRVLLCAPSNCAVDHLVSKLLDIRSTLGKNKFNMVRVGNFDMMSEEAKNVSLIKLAENSIKTLMNPAFAKIKLESLEKREKYLMSASAQQTNSTKQKTLDIETNDVRRFIRQLRLLTVGKADESIKKNLMKRYERDLLVNADIVATTLSSSCCPPIQQHLLSSNSKAFGCCVVDEASQATELQCLSPILLGVDKFILVGDHKQLPPVVVSQEAKNDGLEVSLFERLYNCWKDRESSQIIGLKKQYRMHREIAMFPNSAFYNGSLESMHRPPHHSLHPYLVFSHTFMQDPDMERNIEEARLVVMLVKIMMSLSECSSLSIGVITPYQAQRHTIASSLSQQGLKKSVSVMTVDSAQGQERDVVILSCVKTHTLGFLTDPNRINVALTRAKHALFILANFQSLKDNQTWRYLLEDAKKRKVVRDIGSMPSESDMKRYICRQKKPRTST